MTQSHFQSLPSEPQFHQLELEVLQFWQERQIFKQSLTKTAQGKVFTIFDGPPTANAKPPLHTLVPMAFKDAIGRYKTMRGYYVPRQAGWDTHGLPVEVQMEKKLGYSSKKEILSSVPGDEAASIAQFNAACKQSVWEFKQEWDRFVPRVGYAVDIANPYVTYDTAYIEQVWGVFKQIWQKDLVYKGYKVLPYCPRCETGLSAAEVAQEYVDTKDVSVYVTFPLKSQPNRSFLAWTTTPWTLPGNVAVALGPKIEYVVVEQGLEQYILAKERLCVLKGPYTIIEEHLGQDLLGLEYEPLFAGVMDGAEGRRYLSVPAGFVTTTDGTGIVHTACMYGVDDFELGRAEGLTMEHTVDLQGHFLPKVEGLAGTYIRDALIPILKYLDQAHRLYAKESIVHSYPFCWRCHTALIYYAKDSWYIAMSKQRAELVRANQAVQWIPEHIKDGRFGDFIKDARDWAVSRERFWGTPLPIWTASDGKQLCVGSIAELRSLAKDPSLVGDQFDPHRPYINQIVLVKDGQEYQPEPYVLDCWFDSGAMPYASGRKQAGQFPADFIAEAIDQTRGWFNSLLCISTILDNQSSYSRVACIGHLVDEHGKKMSKSLGNIFDPWEMFEHYGVDPIRWFIYTTNSPGESKAFGLKELGLSFRKSTSLLYNIFSYFVTFANLAGFKPGIVQPATQLDQWILSLTDQTIVEVTAHLDSFDLMRAGRTLESYLLELSTWYLRRNKKRTDTQFFSVMHHCLLSLVQMLAPLMPFLSEYIYRVIKPAELPESVHLTDWPQPMQYRNPALEEQMAQVRQAVELGLALRMELKLKVRQPLARAWINLDLPAELVEIIADELNVEQVLKSAPDVGIPSKSSSQLVVGLDPVLTDQLQEKGQARELLRQLQNLRKQSGLQPGQWVSLQAGPEAKLIFDQLLPWLPSFSEESYIKVGPESWVRVGEQEIVLNQVRLFVSLVPIS